MLGTANHGTVKMAQMLAGIDDFVRKLGVLDLRHSSEEVRDIFLTFPGLYQLLPSPLVLPEAERLYRVETYGEIPASARHLAAARAFHESLVDIVDPVRMIIVAGDNQPTPAAIIDWRSWRTSKAAYKTTTRGDGTVSHTLGLLPGIPAYAVESTHGELPGNPEVLSAVHELLRTGAARGLTKLA